MLQVAQGGDSRAGVPVPLRLCGLLYSVSRFFIYFSLILQYQKYRFSKQSWDILANVFAKNRVCSILYYFLFRVDIPFLNSASWGISFRAYSVYGNFKLRRMVLRILRDTECHSPYADIAEPKRHTANKSIYVVPEKKLRGLSPNFHIHVSVSDLYITTIGPLIFLQQNRQTNGGNTVSVYINRSQKHECSNRDWGSAVSFFWEYLFRKFGILSLQCMTFRVCLLNTKL